MKIGDKLYCIKDLVHFGVTFFIENQNYRVDSIENNAGGTAISVFIEDERRRASHFNLSPINEDEYNFYDYFINEKQIRKIKIQKINESR